MPLSCYIPSQIISKSRVVHLADKQILKRHILSYPKIIVSKNPPRAGGGGEGGSIPGPWTIELSVGLIACFPVLSCCGGAPIVFRTVSGPDCFPILSSCGGAPIVFRAVSGPDCFPILSSCGGAPIVFRAVSGPDCLFSCSIQLWWCTHCF